MVFLKGKKIAVLLCKRLQYCYAGRPADGTVLTRKSVCVRTLLDGTGRMRLKHIFVVNPNSGKKKNRVRFFEKLEERAKAAGAEYEIYRTAAAGDGESYVRKTCERYQGTGESLRIYACGGDGTINEVVNGAFRYENVEIGAVPLGTGNDYIRNYGKAADFLDPARLLAGRSVYSDLIAYRAEYEGKVTEGCCANMFNIGFDCNVVDMTARVKNWPLVGVRWLT